MTQKLGIEEDKVQELCLSLYKIYGTTMAGLKVCIFYSNFTCVVYLSVYCKPFVYNVFDSFRLWVMTLTMMISIGTQLSLPLLYFCLSLLLLRRMELEIPFLLLHSFVHGRLPYATLKPDPVLRNIILSLPIRKVVRVFLLTSYILVSHSPIYSLNLHFCTQVFTNADKAHAAKIIARLGLENCFERIISFETLNPITKTESFVVATGTREIFDISSYMANPDPSIELPKTPVICKPSEGAFEQVFKMTNINPHKTVRTQLNLHLFLFFYYLITKP